MKRGYTKAWRKEIESKVWLMPPLYLKVWYFLRHKVQYEPFLFPTHKGIGIWVLPGQRLTSLQEIAEGVKWSEWGREIIPNKKTIKTVLDWMVDEDMVTVESNAKGTLISIINWDTYNHVDITESNAKGTRSGSPKERGLDTRKELIELEKEDQKPSLPKPRKRKTLSEDTPDFKLFTSWFTYAFEVTMNYEYQFEGSKDGKTVKDMLRNVPVKNLICKAAHFLADDKRFPLDKAPTITFLRSKINDYPDHINGKTDAYREMGLIPPEGLSIPEWLNQQRGEYGETATA